MKPLQSTLLVFVGAGIGAVARYWIATFVQVRFHSPFPWPTLVVNVTGSVAIGIVMAWLLARRPRGLYDLLGVRLRAGDERCVCARVLVRFRSGEALVQAFFLKTTRIVGVAGAFACLPLPL